MNRELSSTKEEQDFNDWFDSLTPEEQQEYFAEQEADRYIDEAKSFAMSTLEEC